MKNWAFTALGLTCLTIILCSGWADAQSRQLPLGHVNLPVNAVACPTGYEAGTACFSGTLNCPNTLDIGFTYGVVNRGGRDGTVVFFNGQYGTEVGFAQYIAPYTPPQHDFQTVQVIWKSAWEDTGNGAGIDLKTAACRPATLMDWLLNQRNVYSGGGMCAQGASAGSAAIAYSLAEYGAYQYLTHVELESGPVLSDVSVGCNPASPAVNVCSGNHCLTGGEGSWLDSPLYVNGGQGVVSTWTGASGANKCVIGTGISQPQYVAWKAMSIVDGLTGPQADTTFAYPHTSIAGWLCSKQPGCRTSSCQNNSAAEGQVFYQNVTTPTSVYRVDNCAGPEGVEDGNVPQLNHEAGLQAIITEMLDHCGP
ncbi:MAG: hypothetical protein WB562_12985 [Candidatus Sulfotelmatobacter sp.]